MAVFFNRGGIYLIQKDGRMGRVQLIGLNCISPYPHLIAYFTLIKVLIYCIEVGSLLYDESVLVNKKYSKMLKRYEKKSFTISSHDRISCKKRTKLIGTSFLSFPVLHVFLRIFAETLKSSSTQRWTQIWEKWRVDKHTCLYLLCMCLYIYVK